MKINQSNKGKLFGTLTGLAVAAVCITYCYLVPQMWLIYFLTFLYIPTGLWIGYTYDSMYHLASIDTLTGAVNRRMLIQMLHRYLALADRTSSTLSIIFIDVDKFKQINDRYGHEQGDHALQVITKTIEANVRATDVVGRIGGDEFVILCPGLSREQGVCLVKRIKKGLAQQAWKLPLGVSAGISVYPEDGQTADLLLSRADETMYHNKTQKVVHG